MNFCVAKIPQGGAVAAPVAGNILSEVLPYLEIKKKEEQTLEKVSVPNITGMTVKDAKKLLSEIRLKYQDK